MSKPSSSLYLFKKAFNLSFINIWRNKFLSLVTIFVIGIIIFIFNVILAINFIAQDSLNNLSKKVDLVIYLKESTNIEQSQAIIEDIIPLEGVESVSYISKEEALNRLDETHPDISSAFTEYDLGNPLPASINVKTTHPQFHKNILEFLGQAEYKAYLSNTTNLNDSTNNAIMSSVSENLINLSNFTEQVIFWLIVTFVIGGALITLNALQMTIFTRRKEIEVMKLVGASYFFIRLPFIIEAIIYAVLAILISTIMLFALAKNLQIPTITGSEKFYLILIIELIITMSLTTFSSIIAVHEHLLKKTS